jgi:cytochrome c556
MTPGQIMSAAFRGNPSLLSKATSPTATDAEKKAFLDFAKAFTTTKAPKGDAADWSKRTGAILSAAQDVVDGKDNASDTLKTATNCKSCHDLYR